MTQNISGENQSQTGKEKCLVQIRLIATMAFVLIQSLPIVQNAAETDFKKKKEILNATPVQTSQIPRQPVHTTAYQPVPAVQQHPFHQLPYPQQSVAYKPTCPVLQPTPNCSYNDQHPSGLIGQMHMPGSQMRTLAPPVMWHSGMSTNKYEFVLLESCVKKVLWLWHQFGRET